MRSGDGSEGPAEGGVEAGVFDEGGEAEFSAVAVAAAVRGGQSRGLESGAELANAAGEGPPVSEGREPIQEPRAVDAVAAFVEGTAEDGSGTVRKGVGDGVGNVDDAVVFGGGDDVEEAVGGIVVRGVEHGGDGADGVFHVNEGSPGVAGGVEDDATGSDR